MRWRDALIVSGATAAFMLIVQPERLFSPTADARDTTLSAEMDPLFAWQDAPAERDRTSDRRRRGKNDRDRFSGGFPPYDPIPDPDVFSAELVALCIEVAREVNPELADRLRTVCDEDPDEFEAIMRTRARRILGLAMLKNRSPELYNLRMQDMQYEQQADEYARQMRAAYSEGDVSKAEDYEQRLRRTLEVKFALSIKEKFDYLTLMEQHVESMRQSLEDDAANFKSLIDEQIERYKNPPRRRWHRHDDVEYDVRPSGNR